MTSFKIEKIIIEGIYGVCEGRLIEQIYCPYTVRKGELLSCAYCPFGKAIAALRAHKRGEKT